MCQLMSTCSQYQESQAYRTGRTYKLVAHTAATGPTSATDYEIPAIVWVEFGGIQRVGEGHFAECDFR